MQIPSLTSVVTHIQNPNKQLGVLIEEIPSDIGRSYQGYKRGGIIEGAEKLRKEVMAALIWLFGIQAFKTAGDKVFERSFKVPMNVDFSNESDGNDAIGNTVKYIYNGENPKNLDVSELKPEYIKKFRFADSGNLSKITKKLSPDEIASVAKKISTGKKITSVVAIALNCFLMGIALPKFNQMLTRKKLEKQNQKNYRPKTISMKEFTENTKNKKPYSPSFTGFFGDLSQYGLTYAVGYNTENNNTFRLISTDIPMIAGRVATSRNKFEGFENCFMDTASIFFYNFSTPLVQFGLRKLSKCIKKPVPGIKPAVSDYISQLPEEKLKEVFKNLDEKSNIKKISEVFGEEDVKNIYREGTYGKFGKINKFVKNSDIEDINKEVINFLGHVKSKLKDTDSISDVIKKLTKKTNAINAGFLGAGLLVSIAGLSYIVPKLTFFITKKLTGKDTFPGITKYEDNKTEKAQVK